MIILPEDDKTLNMIRMMIDKTIMKIRKLWILSSHLYSWTECEPLIIRNMPFADVFASFFLLMCESIFRFGDYVFHTKYLFIVVT